MTQREQQLLRWIEENPMISQEELAQRAGIARSSVAVHIGNLMKKGYIAGKGYILSQAPYCVVIGAVNVDLIGKAFSPLVSGDSNPGVMHLSLGGVGRNIAHNLSLLGADVRMLTAMGTDVYSQQIAESCRELGIDISRAMKVPDCRTSTYLCLCGPSGDMELAVSDMAVCERITPEYLSGCKGLLAGAGIIVLDANVPEETCRWAAENCAAPIYADPVSTHKAKKMLPILGKLHTLKPNRKEAEILTGIEIRTMQDVGNAADALLRTGLQQVFISLGADGVYAAAQDRHVHLKNLQGDMVNTTGCGDAFMAAVVRAGLAGMDVEEAAKFGLAASAITMEYPDAINPSLSCESAGRRGGCTFPPLTTNFLR